MAVAGRQFRSPVAARALTLARRFTRIDTTIHRGEGAGLRLNAAGTKLEYVLGTAEPAVQRLFAELCRPKAVIHDIGANIGFFTMIAARSVGPTGRVVAFDPVSHHLDAVAHNAALNGFLNVDVHRVALGATDGPADFLLADDPTQSRILRSGSLAGGGTRTTVPVRTLDALISDGSVPVPDVIKMDVEGAEIEAILGMLDTLATHRPTVLCEVHGRTGEFITLMEQHGYAIEMVGGAVHASVEDAPWLVHLLARPRA